MGRVVYSVASSLDGFNTDAQGDVSWAVPDEEVIAALTADVSTAAGECGPDRGHGASVGPVSSMWFELLMCPIIVGAGTRVLPDKVRASLSLTRERRFGNGMVQLTYDVR
ncbi:hypothetical protein ACFVKB_28370 [Rhodococcus sp. NPDC127530]|uniref:hypothetical protein n=1 Tax=unclassified Rhodococcus (in: high G+C Gram-positive bacteria) TaxID=192944 RepID=UPI00363F10B1